MRVHKIYEKYPALLDGSVGVENFEINSEDIYQYQRLWEDEHQKDFPETECDTLPFEKCYFEIIDEDGRSGCFVLDSDKCWILAIYWFADKQIIHNGVWYYDKTEDSLIEIQDVDPNTGIPTFTSEPESKKAFDEYIGREDHANHCLVCIQETIEILKNKEIKAINNIPSKKLNKKRSKKHKPPFLSYKTLNIPNFIKNKKQSLFQIEKRKSPRWHRRRGHVRRLRSGKVVNVRPATIGRIDDGMVMKDYRLSNRGLHERHLH